MSWVRGKWKRYSALAAILALLLLAVGFFVIAPSRVGRQMNETRTLSPYAVPPDVRAFYDTLTVADLHADSLLWCRDLSEKSAWGHVDIPRLREANVAIQAFTVVTKSPKGQNIESTTADAPDQITPLVIAQRWPVRTWFSLRERALYQARRLHALADNDPNLVVLRNAADVDDLMRRRADNPALVGALLGVEGLHCLEGELDNIDVLYDAGFRMMGATHFFDNEMGGSAHGITNAGLSEFGRAAVARMDERGIIIDLAHASRALIDDVLAATTRPVLVSHTGVNGTCDDERNLDDEHIRAIASGGGLIGIGLWKTAVCGEDAAATARAMKYVADQVGVNHVALGSDFDGAVTTPFDVTGLPLLVEAMLEAGFTRDEVAMVMGDNVRDFLLRTLPET